MPFGQNVQRLRRAAGLSQEELAERLGVTRQAVSKWERDSAYPEMEKLARMSQLFGVTVEALLNGDPAPAQARPAVGGRGIDVVGDKDQHGPPPFHVAGSHRPVWRGVYFHISGG